MKKHMENLLKLKTTELQEKVSNLKSEIELARRSVMTGETTNHQTIKQKRRELARVHTMLSKQTDGEAEKPAKTADKEKK